MSSSKDISKCFRVLPFITHLRNQLNTIPSSPEARSTPDCLTNMQAKVECECLEAEVNEAEKLIADEVVHRQKLQLKTSLYRVQRLQRNLDTFRRCEIHTLQQEVKLLGAAQDRWLHMTECEITKQQSLLQERQMKEFQLKCELWTMNDLKKRSDCSVEKLESLSAVFSKRINDQEKAYKVHCKFMEEAVKNASETSSGARKVYKILSGF